MRQKNNDKEICFRNTHAGGGRGAVDIPRDCPHQIGELA